MRSRRQAEMVLFVERHCETHDGLVGTVGKLNVIPGAINVIPQDVELTIDVRSGDNALREEASAHSTRLSAKLRDAAASPSTSCRFIPPKLRPATRCCRTRLPRRLRRTASRCDVCRAAPVTMQWSFLQCVGWQCCSFAAATTGSAIIRTRR